MADISVVTTAMAIAEAFNKKPINVAVEGVGSGIPYTLWLNTGDGNDLLLSLQAGLVGTDGIVGAMFLTFVVSRLQAIWQQHIVVEARKAAMDTTGAAIEQAQKSEFETDEEKLGTIINDGLSMIDEIYKAIVALDSKITIESHVEES
jgi:hypothetical protein